MTKVTSYRPMVLVDADFAGNALRFATREEAEASARDLMGRWMAVREIRVDESDDPVNYRWIDGRLAAVEAVDG